jgi:spore germination cell wall hydrolase CwlJ-like protein
VERLAAATLLLASFTTSALFAPPTNLPVVREQLTVHRTMEITTVHPDDATLEMNATLLAAVARAEDPNAPAAVMWVVRNRARAWHRNDLFRAVFDGESFGTRKKLGGAWEPIRTNWPRNARMIQLESLAIQVLLGKRKDPTGGATNFHRVGTWEPPWAPPLNMRKVFGSHYFYKAYKPNVQTGR